MELTSVKTIQQQLREHDLAPNKRLGQHFLVSDRALQQIVEAAGLSDTDTVLEIGAGIGTLTKALAERAARVIAVEKDERLIPLLRHNTAGYDNVDIINADIRDVLKHISHKPSATSHKRNQASATAYSLKNLTTARTSMFEPYGLRLRADGCKVVGNIPYYLTSHFIRLLHETNALSYSLAVLTIQREVADRLTALPPHMNLLAVATQYYAEPEIVARLPRGAFWPTPEVASAIVKLKPRHQPSAICSEHQGSDCRSGSSSHKLRADSESFFAVVRAGFAQPRKTLANNLSAQLGCERRVVHQWLAWCTIEQSVRPAALTIEQWQCLTTYYQQWRDTS